MLTLTIGSVTPAVTAAAGKDGHPELSIFAAAPASAQLTVTVTADWFADGGASLATVLSGAWKRCVLPKTGLPQSAVALAHNQNEKWLR